MHRRRDGHEWLYPSSRLPVVVDADARDECWCAIHGLPEPKGDSTNHLNRSRRLRKAVITAPLRG